VASQFQPSVVEQAAATDLPAVIQTAMVSLLDAAVAVDLEAVDAQRNVSLLEIAATADVPATASGSQFGVSVTEQAAGEDTIGVELLPGFVGSLRAPINRRTGGVARPVSSGTERPTNRPKSGR
jgi:hypothetical protein